VRPAPGSPPPALEIAFPLVVKPLTRTPGWTGLVGARKALHLLGPDEFARAWPTLAELPAELLVQQLIPGPESRVESFHVYIDAAGAIAAEFTGRKIRTYPQRYGRSTAVEVVWVPDVAELGREVVARLALRGVAKLDFKRDDRGRLHLLEINPRFNLWHYPAAVAGVNLPAIVYADLTGRERPAPTTLTRQVVWCDLLQDLRAARTAGISAPAWLWWMRRCRAICGLSWDDPLPFVRGKLWGATWRRTGARAVSGARRSDASLPAPRARRGRRGRYG
jgi:D-aspartate ligase